MLPCFFGITLLAAVGCHADGGAILARQSIKGLGLTVFACRQRCARPVDGLKVANAISRALAYVISVSCRCPENAVVDLRKAHIPHLALPCYKIGATHFRPESSPRSLDDQFSSHRRMHQAGVGEGAALRRADRHRQ